MRPIISVLVPTRGRPYEFLDMQDSLDDPAEVEVLSALDSCDKMLDQYVFKWSTRAMVGERQVLTVRWNQMAAEARGDYLMLGNDDMRFTGPEWIELLRGVDPGEPAVIGFNDGPESESRFSFPVLTREAYRRLGYFMPEKLRGLWADTWLHDLGRRAGCLRYFPEYKVEHLHWSNGRRGQDGTDGDRSMRGGGGDKHIYEGAERDRAKDARRLAGD